MGRPLLLGHRGARGVRSIPENTFASFDRALIDGCDGFEFDVRLTADGQAVVCHDPKVERLQIARADAEKLPGLARLEDVLERYRNAFLDIELKVPGLETIVHHLVKERNPDRYVVSSFLPEVLQSIQALDASIPLGLICETKTQLHAWEQSPASSIMMEHKLASAALIRKLKAAGKRVFVWTVNKPEDMQRFAKFGVDGIISDKTAVLREVVGA
jgi:glycerophosphoryl diester phosphodiesterase